MTKPKHIFSTVFPFGNGWLENRMVFQTALGIVSCREVGARNSRTRCRYDFRKHASAEEVLTTPTPTNLVTV
jgi:hypothetical protein